MMRRKSRRAAWTFGWLLALVNSGCTPQASGVSFGSGLPRVLPSDETHQQEHAMFEYLNQDRRAQGLPPLAYDERLADVARFHSADMRDNHFFAHDSPTTGSLEDRLNASGYLFLTARENLSEALDPKQGQQNLMNSPPHHANIMATDVSHVGIGIVEGGAHDPRNLLLTQVFATPSREETEAGAREAMTEALQLARSQRGLRKAEVHPSLQELAEAHVEKLGNDADPSRVQQASNEVAQHLASLKGIRNVVIGGQMLPDSGAFQPPAPLLQSDAAVYGLAVNRVAAQDGRPMLIVLIIAAEH